jgi:hypothetical protein
MEEVMNEFIDCTQDDHLVEDTENGPNPVDGDQANVDQDSISEDDAELEVIVGDFQNVNLPTSEVPPGAQS